MKLFDLDGTLLDSNGIWQEIDVAFLGRRGIPWSEEYNQGVIHAIFPTAAQFTKEFCHLEESPEEIMAEWLDMAREGYAHTLQAKEGALDYLARCAARGERMALFTSAEPSLCRAALENSGNAYDLHKWVMDKGMICPVLFISYAVYTTRGATPNLSPAVDWVIHGQEELS